MNSRSDNSVRREDAINILKKVLITQKNAQCVESQRLTAKVIICMGAMLD